MAQRQQAAGLAVEMQQEAEINRARRTRLLRPCRRRRPGRRRRADPGRSRWPRPATPRVPQPVAGHAGRAFASGGERCDTGRSAGRGAPGDARDRHRGPGRRRRRLHALGRRAGAGRSGPAARAAAAEDRRTQARGADACGRRLVRPVEAPARGLRGQGQCGEALGPAQQPARTRGQDPPARACREADQAPRRRFSPPARRPMRPAPG